MAEQGAIQARNILLPEARRLVNIGAFDKARVHYEAAKRLGAPDGNTEVAIKAHLDATEPHRREAIEAIRALEGEVTEFRLDAVKARVIHGIGSEAQQMVDRDYANFLEWKGKREDQMIAEADGKQVAPVTVPEEEAPPRRSG